MLSIISPCEEGTSFEKVPWKSIYSEKVVAV